MNASLRTPRATGALAGGLLVAGALAASGASAEGSLIDLTHPMSTFKPLEGDIAQPDLASPYGDSIAYPTFGKQTVYDASYYFTTNQGQFYGGRVVLYDHHGTHLDAPAHFKNFAETVEAGNPPQKHLHEITVEELVGPAVVIDIGSRIDAELDKNGGMPSPDPSVTDFSNDSPNVVGAEDIDAVADRLADGVWLVVHTGWSRFYYDANWDTSPYINGWNFPGLNKAAVDRLIEIEDDRGIRIAGIVIDNIGVDTGESSRGSDDKWTDSWHSHVRGLQRGWKFVENATNLGQLAMANPGSCRIIVGAPKNVLGGGGPSRVLALCE